MHVCRSCGPLGRGWGKAGLSSAPIVHEYFRVFCGGRLSGRVGKNGGVKKGAEFAWRRLGACNTCWIFLLQKPRNTAGTVWSGQGLPLCVSDACNLQSTHCHVIKFFLI